jgi:hypothetical protein
MACCFVGELVIIPIHGRDLPKRERFGKQDPFILFKLGNVSKRTSTDVRGGQRPRWNDEQVKNRNNLIEDWRYHQDSIFGVSWSLVDGQCAPIAKGVA